MTNQFPVSIQTIESDVLAGIASTCASLNIDPSERLIMRDGETVTERPVADILREALLASVGVMPGCDIAIWRSS